MEAVAKSDSGAAANAPRILLVAPPAEGGIASHVTSLIDGLRKNEYAVCVVCEEGGRIAAAAAARDVPVHGMVCSARGGPLRVAMRAVRLARVIAGFRPQVVHTHSYGATAIGSAACAIARWPALVVTIHNYPPGSNSVAPKGGGGRRAFEAAVRRAKRIITVSEALRRDLVECYPETMARSTTIYNGVDTQRPAATDRADVRARIGVSADVRLVGVVARLAPQKGIVEFMRAARLVAEAYPSVAFALAGDGPMMPEIVGLRQELGVEQQLRLLGHIDWVRDFIESLDVLVVPSLTEGSSVVAMEAMAAGKPVVATTVGGVPEVVSGGETGVLVRPGEVEELAEGVLEVLRDPARAQEMGERGRQRAVMQFDINDMVERTKAVYADVIRDFRRAGRERG